MWPKNVITQILQSLYNFISTLAVTGGINRSPRSPTAGRQRNYKALLKSILNRRRNGRENWTDPCTIERSQWSSQVNLPKKIRDYINSMTNFHEKY